MGCLRSIAQLLAVQVTKQLTMRAEVVRVCPVSVRLVSHETPRDKYLCNRTFCSEKGSTCKLACSARRGVQSPSATREKYTRARNSYQPPRKNESVRTPRRTISWPAKARAFHFFAVWLLAACLCVREQTAQPVSHSLPPRSFSQKKKPNKVLKSYSARDCRPAHPLRNLASVGLLHCDVQYSLRREDGQEPGPQRQQEGPWAL